MTDRSEEKLKNSIETMDSKGSFGSWFSSLFSCITNSDIDSDKVKYRPSSLKNMGANCYLNSAFQGISACDTFAKEINDLTVKNKGNNVKKLEVFKELIDILNGCSRGEIEISTNPIFCQWNKPGQQDSYEVLAYALNQVYNELRNYKENIGDIPSRDLASWLQESLPLRLIIQYNLNCECGMKEECPIQSDLALHVTIPKDEKKCELNKLLDIYFKEDFIIDYECGKPNCIGKRCTRVSRLRRPLPQTICIHLQRTYWNGRRMKKIDKEVKFSSELIIKPDYCYDDSMIKVDGEDKHKIIAVKTNENCDETPKEKIKNNDDIDDRIKNENDKNQHMLIENNDEEATRNKNIQERKNEVYDLVSVIQHQGTAGGGHYICYKKVNTQWFLTNDSYVKKVNERQVLDCQAYILFYEQPYKIVDI